MGHTIGMEGLEVGRPLADAGEVDRAPGHPGDRERRAAASVAVQLGQDETGRVDLLHECPGLDHGVLPRHGVARHQDVVGLRRILDLSGLAHHLPVHMQAARRVDDHDVASQPLGLLHTVPGHPFGVLAVRDNGDTDLLAQGEQLLDRRRSLEIRGDQHGLLPLLLQMEGELGARGGLPRPLDSGHHHDGRVRAGDLERLVLAAQRLRELVAHHLHDLLGRRERRHDLVAQRAGPHARQEVVHHLDGGVRLDQCSADVGQRVIHLLGVELAPLPELAEDGVQPSGQRIEHRSKCSGRGLQYGGRRRLIIGKCLTLRVQSVTSSSSLVAAITKSAMSTPGCDLE